MMADQSSRSECAVLVVSCDNYRDTWRPFFELLKKNWADCPFPVYHLTNYLQLCPDDVRSICVGPDKSWSANVLTALREISEPYVLLLLDDLFVVRPVANTEVVGAIDWLIEKRGNHLRLNALPKPDRRVNSKIGEIAPGSAYRVSTVTTVWKREILTQLLRKEESAWEFEIAGSRRSDGVDGFFSTYSPLILVENTIIKGKWRPSSIQKVAKLGVTINTERRPIMSGTEELEIRARIFLNRALHYLPLPWRRPIQVLFKSAAAAVPSVKV
jgi:hypothetical protein